jgi:hypothetical protein
MTMIGSSRWEGVVNCDNLWLDQQLPKGPTR